ncbi:MAG: hypothetical protein ACRDEA_05105 [Microcystaceae cyanobacterium]
MVQSVLLRKKVYCLDSLEIWYLQAFKQPTTSEIGVSPEGYYSTSALADKLGVGIHTIYYWRDKGIISAFQETPKSPWWYIVTPEVLKTLREKIRRVPVKSE